MVTSSAIISRRRRCMVNNNNIRRQFQFFFFFFNVVPFVKQQLLYAQSNNFCGHRLNFIIYSIEWECQSEGWGAAEWNVISASVGWRSTRKIFNEDKKNENKKPVRRFTNIRPFFLRTLLFFLTLGRKLNVFCVTKLPELRMIVADWRQVGR